MTTRRRAAEGDIAPAAKAAKLRASARNSSMGECDENNARVAALRRVRLCIVDGPTHFSVYKSKLTVKGEKGYRMIRATHGVQEGSMYYEVRFNAQDPVIIPGGDHPPTSLPPASKGHIRVGWSREKGDIDVPVGFDEFSYGFGDAQGRRFHRSLARPYAAPFHPGDVIGCLVTLPVVGRDGDGDGEGETAELGSPRDSAVVEADRLLADLKDQFKRQFTTLHGSHISFYLNGEPLGRAFESIPGGPYFPAVSLYNGASVTVNFGPDFEYPPFDNLFTERSAAVECTVDANQLAAVTVVAATPLNSGPNSGPSSGSAGNNGGGGGNYSSSAGGSGSASAGSGTGTGSSSSSSGGNNNSNSGSSGSSGTNAAYSLGLPPGSVHGSGSGLSSGNRHGGAEGSGDGGDGDSSGTLMSLPFIGYLSDVAAWARPQIKPAVGLGDEECSVFAATDAADGEGIIETLKKQLAMKKAKRSGASHRKDTKKRGKKPTSAAAPLLPTGSEDGAGAGADEEDGDADAGAAMTDSAGPGSSPTATSATAATAAGAADAAAAAACAGAGGGAAAAAAAAAAAEKKEKGRALARTIVYRRRQRVYPVLVPNPRLEDEPDCRMASLVNVAKASSVDPPVLAVFSTGVPTVVSTSDSFSFQYFSNPRKPNEGVVFGESAQTHYLGTNTATAALTKNRNNYAVGVYRAGRDSVRIVPAHGLFVMKEANNADAAGLDLTTIAGSDYATVRTQLTERFGSRKRRRELRSEQANAFDVNANKSAALAAQMAFESAATLVPATDGNAGMHAARLEKLPAFNADAETPEGIYAFSALLPESAWSALDHKAVLAPEESAEELRAIYPRFVLIHLKRAQEMARVDRDAAKTLARQLVHLTYLLRLIRSRQGSQLRDLEDYTLAPHAVCTHIGRTYFEGRKLTDGARAKLSCHIAVLSLLCSPLLSIDAAGLEALAQDQQTTVLKLLPFFAEVGCKNASRTRAALTAPLQLPDVPTGGFRAR